MSERQWVNKKCELGFHREEAEKPHSKSNGLQEELQERQSGNPGKEGANKEKPLDGSEAAFGHCQSR